MTVGTSNHALNNSGIPRQSSLSSFAYLLFFFGMLLFVPLVYGIICISVGVAGDASVNLSVLVLDSR